MEGERERLNRRISALTEQLADAKFANSVETFNVRSLRLFEFWADIDCTNTFRCKGGKSEKPDSKIFWYSF